MNERANGPAAQHINLRDILTDAIRYWEWRRLIYNAALAAVVLVVFALHRSLTWTALTVENGLAVFIQAVLANVAYCAAYPADIIIQFSSFRESWRKRRWLLLLVGTLFAGAIAYFMSLGIFDSTALAQ